MKDETKVNAYLPILMAGAMATVRNPQRKVYGASTIKSNNSLEINKHRKKRKAKNKISIASKRKNRK